MKMHKGIAIALSTVLACFALMAVMLTAAEGPDGMMTIDKPASIWPAAKLDKDTGAKKRPPVTFNHKKHGEEKGCESCHHGPPDPDTGKIEPASCFMADCHGPAPVTLDEGKVKPDSYQIIHDKKIGTCQVCHAGDQESMKEKGQKSNAPVKCAECHVK